MTATFKTLDPCTNHLLDFIAGGVPTNKYGESGGCYDATFGDMDGSVYGDLSSKTLTEIYQMQDNMVAVNKVSSATGRYQALKATLKEYQDRKKLPNGALFTPVMQDDFGLTKMKDRGYDAWRDGIINDDEFMHRLSCEWASLPDPYNDGKSHYDGDSAGNHASTTLDHFRAALRTAAHYLDGTVPAMDADMGIRTIQATLVQTGDLDSEADIDGAWGPRSEAALRALIARDK
jgi:muramidase (phage lysozyme)